jgi:hypothetical protein
MKYMIQLFLLFVLAIGCAENTNNENDSSANSKKLLVEKSFIDFVSELDEMELPTRINAQSSFMGSSDSFDTLSFKKYGHSYALRPVGVFYEKDNRIGIISFGIGDMGAVPFLSTYDSIGNRIDSSSFYETSGYGPGYEAMEYLTFDTGGKIVMTDTIKIYPLNENDDIIDSIVTIKTSRTIFQIMEDGSIEKRK